MLNSIMTSFVKDRNKNLLRLSYFSWIWSFHVSSSKDKLISGIYDIQEININTWSHSSAWKHHYDLLMYYTKAIQEFQEYRNARMIKSIFKFIVCQTKKEKQLKALETRAKDYYRKKQELRLIKSSFSSLKKNYLKEKQIKSGKADMLADNHYFIRVGRMCFNQWRKETKEQKLISEKRNNRELMMSVFSGWKFYAKQNSLVKRYLDECKFSSAGSYAGDIFSCPETNSKSPKYKISHTRGYSNIENQSD